MGLKLGKLVNFNTEGLNSLFKRRDMSRGRAVKDGKTGHVSSMQSKHRNGDIIFKEDLQASRKIERYPIPLDNLKMMFEKPSRIVVMPRKSNKRKVSRLIDPWFLMGMLLL